MYIRIKNTFFKKKSFINITNYLVASYFPFPNMDFFLMKQLSNLLFTGKAICKSCIVPLPVKWFSIIWYNTFQTVCYQPNEFMMNC